MFHKTPVYLFLFFGMICIPFAKGGEANRLLYQENHRPEVKIVTPVMNATYQWNTTIPYSIRVSDQEDGESQYDEIPAGEVFVEVKHLKTPPRPGASLKSLLENDPKGLSLIKTSNCLNCHAQRDKLIGPSFADISKRYSYTPSNVDLLVKRIREGSKGVWGSVVMPTHPELTSEETAAMVKWILQNSGQSDLDLYKGIEGSIRLKKPVNPSQNTFLIIASYTDHGLKDNTGKKLTGEDAVIVRGK